MHQTETIQVVASVGRKPAPTGGTTVLNGSALALSIAGFVNFATGGLAVEPGIAIAGVYVLVSLPFINLTSILPISLAASGVAALFVVERDFEPVLQGLSFAVGLGAFLGSVLLLRSTLIQTMSVACAEKRLAALPDIDQRGAALLIAFVLSCVFSFGTFMLLAPLLEGRPIRERHQLARVMLCGMCLSLLWSPFSNGMVFAAAVLPHAAITQGIEIGAGLSIAGLLAALAIYSRFRLSVLRAALSVLAPMFAPLIALLGAVTVTCWITMVHVTEAIVLVTPGVCAIWSLICARSAFVPTMLTTYARSGRTLSDLLIFVTGLAFARALDESGWLHTLMQEVSASHLSSFILPGLAVAAPLLGMIGLHPSILGGVVAVIGASLPGYQVAGGLFALVLLTWTAASLLSFSAVSVAVASREFQAGVCGLICSPNLAVMAIIGVVAACALASLG